jgi:hypothetical protein
MNDIKLYLKKEKEDISYAQAIATACELQAQHLEHIAAHLPTYLPSLHSVSPPHLESHEAKAKTDAAPPQQRPGPLQERTRNAAIPAKASKSHKAASTSQGLAAFATSSSTAAASAPRRYIAQDEFLSISTYMRGRLTTDKVNAALEELASRAETTAALVAAARRGRTAGIDKKHAQWLAYSVAGHESLRGKQWWVVEGDLRSGQALRLDNSGRMVLTLLRHLGRLTESRIGVDGTTHIVYVIV